jgi:hypothetical protein
MKRALCLTFALVAASASTARGYHAATHAGMTERAALASSLHKRLIERFGRALGLYEPLTLEETSSPERRELDRRLGKLDPEGGYVPDRGRLTAIGWLTAGTALEAVPAARLRNHFYDPSRNRGLDQSGGTALRTRIDSASTGVGSLRGIFTGESFDGSGMSAPDWLRSSENDWGLRRFADELEASGAAATPAEREAALARALLAAGSILHVVEDAGDPTFVRDDYRIALEADAGPYERFVALQYGRLGVPEPGGAPVVVSSLLSLFHDAGGNGLADRTQTRFFSPGTLPDSGRYGLPQAFAANAKSGWIAGVVPHLAHYRRTREGVAWSIDERCWADYAATLLPETTRYAAGALELLFRGRIDVASANGIATVSVHDVALGGGRLSLYADIGDGPRKLVSTQDVTRAAEGDKLRDLTLPAGARRLAVVFRGVDGNGEPIVIVQDTPLPR